MKWFYKLSLLAVIAGSLSMILPTDMTAQRKGGSFGGSRGYAAPRSAPRTAPRSSPRTAPRGGGSFGGTRKQSTEPYSSRPSERQSRNPVGTQQPKSPVSSRQSNSFGGSRLTTSKEYTSRYGIPRKTETRALSSPSGTNTNYVFNRYGGMGDGYMMGYVMGAAPWFYHMPFHPAFYYSRPYTVVNGDGTVGVYPGTFQWGTMFFMFLLIAGGSYIIYVWLKRKRERHRFGGADMSRSSFG